MRTWSLARRLFALYFLFMVLITAVFATLAYLDARERAFGDAAQRTTAIATTIADSPLVLQAAGSKDPSSSLQPFAERVMADSRIDFITIMAPDRTRWTHRNREEIGLPYIGSVDEALAGRSFTETTAGTLGPSVRTIVPVKDANAQVVAMVSVGVTVDAIEDVVASRFVLIGALSLGLLGLGGLLTYLIGRYLKRVTHGWGPEQLGQLFSYYESGLHSVRDGLILVDTAGRLVMYNDQAAALLGVSGPEFKRAPVTLSALDIPASLRELLASGRVAREELFVVGEKLLVVSQERARTPGDSRSRGSVATLQDHTEVQRMGEELRSTRTLTDALRAQTHEHANRIHTIVSLLELGHSEQALEFATQDLTLSQRLVDQVIDKDREPVLAALVMAKATQARESGIDLRVSWDERASFAHLEAHDVVTILGNLLDNAMDAAIEGSRTQSGADPLPGAHPQAGPQAQKNTAELWVSLDIWRESGLILIKVTDSGPGFSVEDPRVILERGFTTKESDSTGRGIGLALVQQAVTRLGGELEVGQDETGAVFTVALPVSLSADGDSTSEISPDEGQIT